MADSHLLDIEQIADGLFVGSSPAYDWGRIYGGLVIAQALMAAGRTVAEGVHPHSLHAYFIRGGDPAHKIVYDVERVRDGRSFSTRAVHARQANGTILMMIASFNVDEDGFEQQNVPMPTDMPSPEDVERSSWMDEMDCREMPGDGSGRFSMWGRWAGGALGSRLEHAAALAFLSDATPMDSIVDTHPVNPPPGEWGNYFMSASLDHTIWFRSDVKADDWLLFDSSSPGLRGNRGVSFGNVFAADGMLVASVGQEGLLRQIGEG